MEKIKCNIGVDNAVLGVRLDAGKLLRALRWDADERDAYMRQEKYTQEYYWAVDHMKAMPDADKPGALQLLIGCRQVMMTYRWAAGAPYPIIDDLWYNAETER